VENQSGSRWVAHGGLTSRHFIRYHRMRLKLGEDLSSCITGQHTKHLIAPLEEGLALKPELASAK